MAIAHNRFSSLAVVEIGKLLNQLSKSLPPFTELKLGVNEKCRLLRSGPLPTCYRFECNIHYSMRRIIHFK